MSIVTNAGGAARAATSSHENHITSIQEIQSNKAPTDELLIVIMSILGLTMLIVVGWGLISDYFWSKK